jgi:outer membrane protein assembly factor BamB
VIINGLLFMAMGEGSGLFICVDLETKKELWTHEIPPCYGSLTASGDRVYATSRDGTVSVFAAEKTARLISSNAIGDSVDSTPAMADGRIYIRSAAFLWCIGAK